MRMHRFRSGLMATLHWLVWLLSLIHIFPAVFYRRFCLRYHTDIHFGSKRRNGHPVTPCSFISLFLVFYSPPAFRNIPCIFSVCICLKRIVPVSYTHLAVYKRQDRFFRLSQVQVDYTHIVIHHQKQRTLTIAILKQLIANRKMTCQRLFPSSCLLYTSVFSLWEKCV